MRIYTDNEQSRIIRNIVSGNNSEVNDNQVQDKDKKKEETERNSVFAGDLTIMTDTIAEKKKEAKEKAAKLIAEQFAADMEIDDSLNEMSDRISKLSEESGNAQKEIDSLNEEKAKLKEEYGITDDSQEQQDLELLEKAASADADHEFTEEETERLAYLNAHPEERTDYQQAALSRDTSILLQQKVINNNMRELEAINTGVRDTKLELLKTNPMLKTQKTADSILEAANKQIIGMAMNDVKETIDENMEAEKEDAKEAEEEKEEQEERIDKVQQDNEAARNNETSEISDAQGTEDTQEVINDSIQKQKDVEAGIKELLEKQKLLEEDLKGISVDQVL